MNRRLAAILLLLTLTCWAGNRADAEEITLKFSHFLGPTSFFQVDLVEPWARELEARTHGRVRVEIYNSSTPLGKVGEQASQVKAGTVDIALGLRGAEGDRFPGTSIIELPFMVRSALSGSRTLWSLYRDGSIADEYADYHVLALSVQDPGLIHTSTRRVVKPADLKGLRLRSPSTTVSAALQQLEAIPVVLQTDAVMPAIKSAAVDGVVTNWASPYQEMNQYMKFHIDLRFYAAAFFIVMNREKYASLPAEVRAAIDSMSGEVLVTRFANLWDQWAVPMRKGADGPDHEMIVPDAFTATQWRTALSPVADRYLTELSVHYPKARAVYTRLREMNQAENQ